MPFLSAIYGLVDFNQTVATILTTVYNAGTIGFSVFKDKKSCPSMSICKTASSGSIGFKEICLVRTILNRH